MLAPIIPNTPLLPLLALTFSEIFAKIFSDILRETVIETETWCGCLNKSLFFTRFSVYAFFNMQGDFCDQI